MKALAKARVQCYNRVIIKPDDADSDSDTEWTAKITTQGSIISQKQRPGEHYVTQITVANDKSALPNNLSSITKQYRNHQGRNHFTCRHISSHPSLANTSPQR